MQHFKDVLLSFSCAGVFLLTFEFVRLKKEMREQFHYERTKYEDMLVEGKINSKQIESQKNIINELNSKYIYQNYLINELSLKLKEIEKSST